MPDLNDMLLFASVVKTRSFTETARRLDISKSRVSKAVSRLESTLGVRLLHRSTRSLSLTDIGEAYFEHCDRIQEELAQAELTLSRLQQEPRGKLKISAPVAFSTMHVASALSGFMMQYPDVSVELTLSDRFVDLAEEGYDVALRITTTPGPNLVARKLAPIRRKICASPAYLERAGTPQSPEDLAQHNCLDYTFLNTQGLWHLKSVGGDVAIPVSGTLRINDDEALSQAVLGGLGLALLPTFIVGKDLQAGRLVEVLPGYVPTEFFIYAIHLPNRHLPSKVRSFIHYLQTCFGTEPYWDKDVAP
ncbi:MAG TPA: LysR family transcriptional regulator [Chitinolyticbacter sp.]|nr:LysR family transcriptional regulator [Chitinolyticbacter sp.]